MTRSAKPHHESQINADELVLKNSLTEEEMDEAGQVWLNHKGPYMTVAETLAYTKTHKPIDKSEDNN